MMLLEFLHKDVDGWLHIWERGPSRISWYHSSEPAPQYDAAAGDVYFTVNPSTENRGPQHQSNRDGISHMVTLYADFDGWLDQQSLVEHILDKGAPEPSAMVFSGGGYHCYWKLATPIAITDENREHVRSLQKRWVHHLEADKGAADLSRKLRMPGTFNHKPERNMAACTLVYLEEEWVYDDTIFDCLPQLDARPGRGTPAPIPATAEEIRRALSHIPEWPGYDTWLTILMAVHSVFPDETGIALCNEWSPGRGGEVEAKFAGFTSSGVTIGTLFYIAKQHGYRPPQRARSLSDEDSASLKNARAWLGSKACNEYIRTNAGGRVVVGAVVATLINLVEYATAHNVTRIHTTMRNLGNALCVSGMTANRRLHKLQELGLITMDDTGKVGWSAIDLRPLLNVTDIFPEGGNNICNAESSFQERHVGDDAFTTYPLKYAQKRRGRTDLLPSLGPTGFLLWGHIERGGTASEIASASGVGRATVKKTLEKFVECGLAEVSMSGRSSYYILVDEAEDVLDEVRPEMHTAWVGQFRIARNLAQMADYAAYRLRRRRHMAPGEVLWWENHRDRKCGEADLIFDVLLEMGFDGRMKVGNEKATRRHRNRYDAGEEWRTWGRPLYDNYVALGNLSHEEKARLITLANTMESLPEPEFRKAYNDTRERLNMMLVLARKRATYEYRGMELVDAPQPPATWTQAQLQLSA